jgi:hypothetical protein
VCRPVQRAEKGTRGNGRIDGAQGAAADAVGHHRADAAFVAVAFCDDAAAKRRRQRIHFEMRRGAFDLVEQTEDVGRRQVAQPVGQRPAIPACRGQRGEQPVERAVLAEEEELVLAAEVVIQVAGGEVGGDRDVAHAGGGEAARAKHAGRGPHDLDPAVVGAK